GAVAVPAAADLHPVPVGARRPAGRGGGAAGSAQPPARALLAAGEGAGDEGQGRGPDGGGPGQPGRLLRPLASFRGGGAGAAGARERQTFVCVPNLAPPTSRAAPRARARLDRAVTEEEQALKAWPVVLAGLTAEELAWYRRAERYFLILLQQRRQEARLQTGR